MSGQISRKRSARARDLVAPHVPVLRPAVEHQERRRVGRAGLGEVEAQARGLDVAVGDALDVRERTRGGGHRARLAGAVTRIWSRIVNERDLDVVVFGATGITGRQVAAYLAERAPRRGALGGGGAQRREGRAGARRDRRAARRRRSSPTSTTRPRWRRWRRGRGWCSTSVGPYTLYGRPVIEACVANGAHYVDLTGEIPFVRQMIDAYDDRAAKAGVKVVQVCGFEALPPDLAVLLAAETARERWGEGLAEADLEVSVSGPPGLPRPSDMISGGTMQSLAAATRARGCGGGHRPGGADHRPGARRGGEAGTQPDHRGAAPRAQRRGDRADGAGGVHQPGRDPAHRQLVAEAGSSRPSRFATARESRSRAAPPRCRCATRRRACCRARRRR